MMPQSELHVVLGARGGVGQVVVRMLADEGKRVRAVNRSGKAGAPPGVELAAADLMQRDAALGRRARVRQSSVHIFRRAAYNKWTGKFPIMMDNIVTASAAAGAKLVFADNCYMTRPDGAPHDGRFAL